MHSDKVSTTASENRDRKKAKPMMEKRRRARMNASLSELKSLLLEVIKKEGTRHSKMEKADILEMTVKHLREMQRKPFTGTSNTDNNPCSKQRLGYNECAQEVSRYLSTMDGCDVDLRARLLDHLANCVTSPGSTGSSEDTPSVSPITTEPADPATGGTGPSIPPIPDHSSLPTDLNNNVPTIAIPQPVQPTQVFNGLQVIPTKLQTGEIAFVLPANVVGGSQIPNCIIPVYSPQNTSPIKMSSPAQSGVPNSGSVIVMPSPTFIHSGGSTNVPLNLNLVTSNGPSVPSSVFPGFSVMSVPSSLKLETQDTVEQSRDHHRHVRDLRTQQPEEDNSVWRPW